MEVRRLCLSKQRKPLVHHIEHFSTCQYPRLDAAACYAIQTESVSAELRYWRTDFLGASVTDVRYSMYTLVNGHSVLFMIIYPHHMAQHHSTGSETSPSYAARSSRFGSEPPSVEDDVDVWHYAIVSCMPETTTTQNDLHIILCWLHLRQCFAGVWMCGANFYKVCCALLYALWHHDIYDDVDDALFRKLAAFSHLVLMVSLELIHQIALVLHQVAPMLLKLRCSWPATNNNMVAPAVLCQFHRLPFTVANTVIIKHNWYSLNEWMTLYTLGP